MLGLVLYGIGKGISSLRGLERLARVDLGCMWITGGLCPDHASIGRFIQQHDAHMSGEFLERLTRSVLRVTASGVETVAGDGTVVQAAASRYRTLKQEAARAAAEAAGYGPERVLCERGYPDIRDVAHLGISADPKEAAPVPLYLRPPEASPPKSGRIERQ